MSLPETTSTASRARATPGRIWPALVAIGLIASPILTAGAFVLQRADRRCDRPTPPLEAAIPPVLFTLALVTAAAALVLCMVDLIGRRSGRLSLGGAMGGATVGLFLILTAALFWSGADGDVCPVALAVVSGP